MRTTSSVFLLAVALAGTWVFGLLMVVATGVAHQGFAWMMFNDAQRILGFAPPALGYVSLLTGVLGAVMMGWAAGLLALLRWVWPVAPLACWRVTALSLGFWFVIDTLFSLKLGAWQNAVLNAVFGVFYLFALWLAFPRQTRLA